jgi:hypothetical protein
MDETRAILARVDATPEPAFVAALEQRLSDEATPTLSLQADVRRGFDLPTLDIVESTGRPEHRRRSIRPLLRIAAALLLFGAGITVGRVAPRSEDPAAASRILAMSAGPEITTTIGRYVVSDGRTMLHYGHGANLATRVDPDGSTSVVRLPAALTNSWIGVAGKRWYAATVDGISVGTYAGSELVWSAPAAAEERTEIMSIAPGSDALWLFRWGPVTGGSIERWTTDLSRRVALARTDLTRVGAMVATDDRLFASTDDGAMWILDEGAAVVGRVWGVGFANHMVLVPNGDLWLGDMWHGGLTAVSTDGVVTARVGVEGPPGVVAVMGTDLVVTSPTSTSLLAVDTATAAITARTSTVDDPLGVAVAGDTVWVSAPRLLQPFTVTIAG